ncbi:unnamed protein product [Effrenium voratum]|nr:unnamed protein product [Effrenium voratum]
MMAFDMLARHIPVLICFTCWLWFLLAADRSARAARAPGPRQSEASPGWELCAAAALLALQACLFLIGEILGQSCGHIHIVSPPAFVVLSSWLFQASYLIWARILLSYTLVLFTNTKEPRGYSPVQGGSREAVEDPSLAAMPQDEMLQVEAPPVPKSRAPVGLAILRAACRTCTLCCGSDALVQPLRERQRLSAVAPLAFLTALLVVGGKCGSYENFRGELDACLGPLLSGEGVTPAPVWLSEFGTDVRDNYFNNIIRYMKENELDFAYWSINGRKRFNESETYGLLQDDNFAVRHPWKLEMVALFGVAAKGFHNRMNSKHVAGKEDVKQEVSEVVLPVLATLAGWCVLMWAIQHDIIPVPGLPQSQNDMFPIVATFIAGYAVIVLEDSLLQMA